MKFKQTILLHTSSKDFEDLKIVIVVPTYNNAGTLASVLQSLAHYTSSILLVNDGSTDKTKAVLENFPNLEVLNFEKNLGKGMALRAGFKRAIDLGYQYAITFDSDGQHYADDLPAFVEKIKENPGTLLVGARRLNQENMPRKNTFGNRFSNFWFYLETGLRLPDTQSGFRLYPLLEIQNFKYLSSKYEFELEVMVKAAWKQIPVLSLPIKVFYAEGDARVSHFRPFKDFVRISILNTYLVFLALLWYRPKQLLMHLHPKNIKSFLNKHFLSNKESEINKSLAVGFGVFMGIIPIWGYQLVSALLLAHVLKLNKAIVGLAANISVPPMIPLLLYGSLKTGEIVLNKKVSFQLFETPLSIDVIKQELFTYVIGSICFAILMALIFGFTSYFVLLLLGKRKQSLKVNGN